MSQVEQKTQVIASYCDYIDNIKNQLSKKIHKDYHDNHYGFPIYDDNELFGRLILEINQAGLSWETILKKQHNFRAAFDNFDINKIAGYDDLKQAKLLANSGIIRNRLKINAVIFNAKAVICIQKEHGSFVNWLDKNHPFTIEQWIKLFKKHFKFVGGEIVREFLVSTGYLEGAHAEHCQVYKKILTKNPKWNQRNQ